MIEGGCTKFEVTLTRPAKPVSGLQVQMQYGIFAKSLYEPAGPDLIALLKVIRHPSRAV